MKRSFKIIFLVILAFIFTANVSAGKINDLLKTEDIVVLDKDYTDDITIGEGRKVTLDLNGYTLNSNIKVWGELTIKDSKGNGKVVLPISLEVGYYKKAIAGNPIKKVGKFTLESGTLEVANDYGIYVVSGSTAILNGGTVNSKYAVLTGNNNTGTMFFEVNGGTHTTEVGPAIYMPGPVSLDMTGGTLNGGISLRMGIINISGGTINATFGAEEDFISEYTYAGNVIFPDAFFVLGGTYTSKDEGETNKLDLTITGGTFNSTNSIGSALAIYDMGKVAQEMNVNISGDAKFITKSKTRNAFDILTLPEVGVTEPTTGYNQPQLIGRVKTLIAGGTYSSSVAKYLTKEYVEETVKNEYIVAKKGVTVDVPVFNENENKNVTEPTLCVSSSNELENILKESLEKTNINTENTNSSIDIEITPKKNNEISSEVKNDFDKYIKENSNLKIDSYFDITLTVKNNITEENLGEISETSKKISFKVALTEELLNTPDGVTRTYYILRYHDGKVEKLDATLLGNILSFESDKFSTYVLVYEDVKNEAPVVEPTQKEEPKTDVVVNAPVIENPKTSDSIMPYVVISLTSLAGIYFAVSTLRKRTKKTN